MKKFDQFKLLIKNSFRILNKSKLLMTQLSFLMIMGLSIILTIFLSNSLLNESKKNIVNNGNLANFTITIPGNIRQESIDNSNEDVPILTDSPADIALREKLDSLGLYYTITENVNLSDVQTNSNFVTYLINNNSEVNDLVTKNNNPIPNSKFNSQSINELSNSISFVKSMDKSFDTILGNYYQIGKDFFNYSNYINVYKPWLLMKLLLNGVWQLNVSSTIKIVNIIEKLVQIPSNEEEYNNYYNIYLSPTQLNTNSYWYKLRQLMVFSTISFNGFGFNIDCGQTVPLLGETATIPFQIKIYDPTSYFCIVSNNYFNSNNKKSIPARTISGALQLPFINYDINDSNLNPSTLINVFNPETNRFEPQSSFLNWFESVPNDYKVYVNGSPFIIVDEGITPDMIYPILNSTNILVDNNNSGVLYVNQSGYNRSIDGTSTNSSIYYSVRYPPDNSQQENINLFNKIVDYTISTYGYNTAYYLNDSNQPNNIIYLRAYFLSNLQNVILIVGIIIGVLIGFLSLFFISTLIRSIIKQNKIVFGIGIANGIKKSILALSFFPFALIPAIICGIISYILSVVLVNPLNDLISQYWTLTIPNSRFEWWYFFVIIFIIFIVLYVLIICIILWTLRKKTQDILNSSSEFRMNWLIIHTKKLASLFGAFGSFRLTYMMGNIVRFVILTLIVMLFSTLISYTVGTYHQFSAAQSYTDRNKNYTYAFNLYSPTINAGYYSPIPYEQIGTTQKGIYNYYSSSSWYEGNYDTPLDAPQGSFYSGSEYANAFADPYNSNLYFTSLYLPYTDLATQLTNNINFFNNKVFIKPILDINLNIGGAIVNPWDIAKGLIPNNILNLALDLFDKQLTTNCEFYYWLQEQNKIAINGGSSPLLDNVDSQFNGQPIFYSTYLPNVNEQPFTLDGSDISDNYLTDINKDAWIFIKELDYSTNKYEWKINPNGINAAPTYTVKPKVIQLIVQIITNSQNPLFQYWYKYFYSDNPNLGKSNQVIPEFSYKVGYGAVPVGADDETYTYIDGDIINQGKNNSSINITGIKQNSNYIELYDSNDNIINDLLFDNTVDNYYPIIINEVVHKLNGFDVGDILSVNANNIYDRFNRRNIGIDPFNNVKFKIVGITSSKSGKQYYTSQEIANKILGYQTFNNPDSSWNGPYNPGFGYIPFNGVFTNQEIPKLFYNYGGIYSPSGLTTSKGLWNTNIGTGPTNVSGGELKSLIKNNWSLLPELTHITNFVDYEDNNNVINITNIDPNINIPMYTNHGDTPITPNDVEGIQNIGDWVRSLVNLFDTDQPFIAQVNSVDTTIVNVGAIFDGTFEKIEMIIAICFIPVLILIITLMATMIISESNRLVSLMKVLGISDVKNAFSFMFVYWVVLFLGIGLSIPITIGGLSLTSMIIFNGFQIIVSPTAPFWIFLIVLGVIGLTFGITCYYGYRKIKKVNVPQAISVR